MLVRALTVAVLAGAVLAIAWPTPARAAETPYDPLDHQEAAMNQLLTWSGLSIAAGALMLASPVPAVRDFGTQNLLWGAIDGGIALLARRSVAEKREKGVDPEAERAFFRRLLLINAGLDVAYVGTGLYLLSRPGLAGHGWGVVTQGGFLLLFDGYHAWEASRAAAPPPTAALAPATP